MKKIALVLLFLLTVLTFVSAPKVAATSDDSRCVTPGLPEDVPREPMPENSTTEDYLNTTNPYSDIIGPESALDEIDDPEGSNPIYVLVFGDEEERSVIRVFLNDLYIWNQWAKLQLERGDEALISNFGIDIRILGFLEWDSDDSIQRMDDPDGPDLWEELESDTAQYLGQWYNGEWWSNYVDVVIGITAQDTPEDPYPRAGLSSSLVELDQGRIFMLLKWRVYWADDNIVQHEVSHLFYTSDHYEPCCAMAYHVHFQTIIWEDAIWLVFNDVVCAYTSYHWCETCSDILDVYKRLYANYDYMLIIHHEDPYKPRGTIYPGLGVYTYDSPTNVSIYASRDPGYHLENWLVDGMTTITRNPTTISVNTKRRVAANWEEGPPAVGGIATPVNKLELLAPYIGFGLASVISIAVVGTVYVKRSKKKH